MQDKLLLPNIADLLPNLPTILPNNLWILPNTTPFLPNQQNLSLKNPLNIEAPHLELLQRGFISLKLNYVFLTTNKLIRSAT